ncbi:MAG: hypothetical protein Q9M32_02950 [Sulfurimonas sp.]|nr:hypothetical protein [Sulfurimonas sp.]MDQ7059693.1 hypothetical protein [Sulfurimonas sp.]
MNLPFFDAIFNPNKNKTLSLPQSLLVKELKKTSDNNNFSIFENITLYHHEKNFFIPLLIVDASRGIFLFEYKDWSYDELKNAKIEKASKQNASTNTLAFEKSHDFIKRKFNELTHNDGVPIYNYLLMENLNHDEYQHLDDSFKTLLPEERIMFNDSSETDILNKMVERVTYNLPDVSSIMSTLLIQYAIIDHKKNIFLASPEQMQFINSELVASMTLKAPSGSGKTSSVLLKAILEKLKNPNINIVIIKPNNLACDILKKKLLDTIEHAIIEIDPTSINILTSQYFLENTPKAIDLLICDDIESYSSDFILDIKNIRNKKHLILVENSNAQDEIKYFNTSFRGYHKEIIFHRTNEHAKTLQIVSNLLLTCQARDILIVSNNLTRRTIKDDLEDFTAEKTSLLDYSQNLMNQNMANILLASYDDINSLEAKYVILMDICSADRQKLEYAYHLCSKSIYVLYNNESKNLNLLRNNFESNKNS